MPEQQRNNPLHGITLQQILEYLESKLGWEKMAQKVRINCFSSDPSIKSSLKFLRKTPWARDKVEQLYLAEVDREAKPATNEFVWPDLSKINPQ
jgi:uncharacterized protein (DUF2132 family)